MPDTDRHEQIAAMRRYERARKAKERATRYQMPPVIEGDRFAALVAGDASVIEERHEHSPYGRVMTAEEADARLGPLKAHRRNGHNQRDSR